MPEPVSRSRNARRPLRGPRRPDHHRHARFPDRPDGPPHHGGPSVNTERHRATAATPVRPKPPIAMLAELTHRCPLSCPYCSNPLELTEKDAESPPRSGSTCSGRPPTSACCNCISRRRAGVAPRSGRSSAVLPRDAGPLHQPHHLGHRPDRTTAERAGRAGVDHVQLSLQGTDPTWPTGSAAIRRLGQDDGLQHWVTEIGFPLTLNAVVHRQNLHRLPDMVDLAERLGARRIEVAIVQFHGWATENRGAMMPTREQAELRGRMVNDARMRLHGRMVLDYVPADHHATIPSPAWGAGARPG